MMDEPSTSSARPRNDEGDDKNRGFPCPRQIKPLLYFYKYLQPLPDGRKLQLLLPPTIVCDKKEGREDVLALSTDANGFVVREEKGPAWRKRLLSDFMGEDQQNAASLLSVGMDDIVAVRNVAHWKSLGGGGVNSNSLVLTRRAFDVIVNAPCDLAFSIQKYVRCRGSHASIFRVTWGERENRRFAINIFNDNKITEARIGKPTTGEHRPQGTAFDAAVRQMAQLSPFYLVTATSGSNPKRLHEQSKLPRVRGSPVMEGLNAVQRIIEHFTTHLPGIRVRELTADFIKDSRGQWWFIRVMNFDACYRIEVPLVIQTNSEIDSASYIHEVLRSKYFRQTLRTIPATPPANCMVPQCLLCGCSCDLPKKLREELHQLSSAVASGGASHKMFRVLSEYRMTLKMVVSTLFQLRQRGESLPLWEHAALLLMKNPVCQASEFTVCYLCYRLYKSQVALSRIALELNEAYGVTCSKPEALDSGELDVYAANEPSDSRGVQPNGSVDRMLTLCTRIQHFQSEACVSLTQDKRSPSRAHVALRQYTPTKGIDVDPTCSQLRFVFFFHELQDGGPNISATDFYLEYHMGQNFSRLDFDGNKRHTPNRWQLCEARVHYLLATTDGFGDYCNDKRIRIKLKTVAGNEYHGYTSLSLRPLISAAKWYSPSAQRETRVDYLLELKTDAFGLMTLKVTLGLLVDPVPFTQIRELIKDEDFLRDGSLAVFWPPPWFQACSLPVPVDWIGALMPSEYVSVLPRPKRQNLVDRQRRHSIDSRKLVHDGKSPSTRFSETNPGVEGQRTVSLDASSPTEKAPTAAMSAHQLLQSVCMVAKRVIYRLAGEVVTFPTVLIGHILRYARFISPAQRSKGIASWAEPAEFHLTANFTMDNLIRDIAVESTGALSIAGEVILVLVQGHLLPRSLRVANLERSLSPYWLLGHGDPKGLSLAFAPISYRVDTISSQHRMVWNRALRRCQAAHFCGEFRSQSWNASVLDDKDVPMTTYEEMETVRRKMSYRVKMQSHLLCEIFEIMETGDSGFIDVAELRSLHKCMHWPPTALFNENTFHDREYLSMEDLETLSTALSVTQETTAAAFVTFLMSSDRMTDALAEFDRFGVGAMNFGEFCELGDSVLKTICSTSEDEPTCTTWCLRHGPTQAFVSDRCCLLCSIQYQDQEFVPLNCSLAGGMTSADSDSDSDAESNGDFKVEDAVPQQLFFSDPEQLDTCAKRPSRLDAVLAYGSNNKEPLDDNTLRTALQQLKAAEWHVRYSRKSLDRQTLETLLAERQASASVNLSRRGTNTSDKSLINNTFSVTEFVTEAEERKQQALGATLQQPRVTRKLKKKRKPVKSKSSALHSTRLQPSHSLSTLLRMELEDQDLRSCDATRSTQLINVVQKGETKRNKLDRLVLAELEDVKLRLARLLASS